jgi:hypothetical protein
MTHWTTASKCGVMTTYAEEFGVLRGARIGKRPHDIDEETTPLRDPGALSVGPQPA